MVVVGIDPGSETGIAFLKVKSGRIAALAAATFPLSHDHVPEILDFLYNNQIVPIDKTDGVFVEEPIPAGRAGLYVVWKNYGIVLGLLWDQGIEPVTIPVNKWRRELLGTTNKVATHEMLAKLAAKHGLVYSSDHELDAFGLAAWYLHMSGAAKIDVKEVAP